MTINEIHIGIKLALQELQSELYLTIKPKAIDYYINAITEELILNLATLDANRFNLIDDDKIKEYYNLIRPLISYVDFPIDYYGEYVVGDIYEDIGNTLVSSGNIYNGIKYKVITAGTANLIPFGGTNPPVVNDIFTASIDDITSFPSYIFEDAIYRIIVTNPGVSYGTGVFGLPSSYRQGTQFTCTTDANQTISPNYDVEYEVVAMPPNDGSGNVEWGGTYLLPITNRGIFAYISSSSNVDCEKSIKSGTLYKGSTYRIVTAGSTDLSSIHGWNSNYVNYLITPTSDYTPTWDGTTELTLTKNVPNTLVLPQDFNNMSSNYYGTDINSPTAVIRNNKLYVYHHNKFNINKVYLTYARIPGRVSNASDGYNVTSELSIHTLLVSLVSQRIAGVNANENYRTLINEYKDTNKNI